MAITTIIFDVDDTLYDVSTGFTAHRNGEVIWKYMVDHLGFENEQEARKVRDEYFAKYHSTAKALTVAQQEGKLPSGAPKFDTEHMAQYWADNLDYSLLGGEKKELHNALASCPLQMVAFSNGPRIYVQRVLESLGLWDLFGHERLFAVDDVLPYCKPEAEAFGIIFEKLGIERPEVCIMVEDSMKNIRQAKALGMKTILITGSNEDGRILPQDKPEATDPTVDCSMESVEQLQLKLPGLWKTNPVFE
ncbi:HAD-like domain containing protein [Nitzschia inconspicua]|uniref:HAD-like domain containing protein n=1 Tax=Nitzschia inconspicua TaxID=303405 RepID=A0A9K3LPB0_9STRA|nr:HAD-like domain containing protein [Nitzschia inconspicua]